MATFLQVVSSEVADGRLKVTFPGTPLTIEDREKGGRIEQLLRNAEKMLAAFMGSSSSEGGQYFVAPSWKAAFQERGVKRFNDVDGSIDTSMMSRFTQFALDLGMSSIDMLFSTDELDENGQLPDRGISAARKPDAFNLIEAFKAAKQLIPSSSAPALNKKWPAMTSWLDNTDSQAVSSLLCQFILPHLFSLFPNSSSTTFSCLLSSLALAPSSRP